MRIKRDAVCPWCGVRSTTHDGPAVPSTGDVSLCWECRQPGVWMEDGSLTRPDDDLLAKILADPRVKQMRGIMMEAITPNEAQDMLRREGLG
jgi:hypothetical protein